MGVRKFGSLLAREGNVLIFDEAHNLLEVGAAQMLKVSVRSFFSKSLVHFCGQDVIHHTSIVQIYSFGDLDNKTGKRYPVGSEWTGHWGVEFRDFGVATGRVNAFKLKA